MNYAWSRRLSPAKFGSQSPLKCSLHLLSVFVSSSTTLKISQRVYANLNAWWILPILQPVSVSRSAFGPAALATGFNSLLIISLLIKGKWESSYCAELCEGLSLPQWFLLHLFISVAFSLSVSVIVVDLWLHYQQLEKRWESKAHFPTYSDLHMVTMYVGSNRLNLLR